MFWLKDKFQIQSSQKEQQFKSNSKKEKTLFKFGLKDFKMELKEFSLMKLEYMNRNNFGIQTLNLRNTIQKIWKENLLEINQLISMENQNIQKKDRDKDRDSYKNSTMNRNLKKIENMMKKIKIQKMKSLLQVVELSLFPILLCMEELTLIIIGLIIQLAITNAGHQVP